MKEISVITGASGTLGKAVTEELLKKKHTVLAIVRNSINNADKNYHELKIDLSDLQNIENNKEKMLKIFKMNNFKKINIIHIAGKYEQQELPLEYEEINNWKEIFNIIAYLLLHRILYMKSIKR